MVGAASAVPEDGSPFDGADTNCYCFVQYSGKTFFPMEQSVARHPKARLSSVANAIRLVKAFSEDQYEIGISGLAAKLGLAKSTVHRLATTLIDAGMLEQNPDTGKYRLGLLVVDLGALARR